jgi:quercetin dioxygenase-like cupin family protein
MPSKSPFLVKAKELPGYSPANHSGTLNRRLISPETVGAKNIEVVLGVIDKGNGALPHAHPGIEQVCYLLSGTASVEVGGATFEMEPGDCCFFPSDEFHTFVATSEEPANVLVIYSPPYEERPDRVVKVMAESNQP